MTDCCISFPGPVSRTTLYNITIDYLKYILYYRGQFPLPLDQLKKEFPVPNTTFPGQVNGHQIYCDHSDFSDQFSCGVPNSSVVKTKTKQKFVETIQKFDDFFNELSRILEEQNVAEIVLNLGSNMMSPKELYRIVLPPKCSSPECAIDYASFQRCRILFFQQIMQSNLWKDLCSDTLLPISVLLHLENGVCLNERMEQKRFYAVPRNCKQRTVHFKDICVHLDNNSLQQFENMSISNDTLLCASANTSLWVKLKPDLKGFKPYFESNRSMSCSS